jgi:predicted AAA+ superfamily ATPase
MNLHGYKKSRDNMNRIIKRLQRVIEEEKELPKFQQDKNFIWRIEQRIARLRRAKQDCCSRIRELKRAKEEKRK